MIWLRSSYVMEVIWCASKRTYIRIVEWGVYIFHQSIYRYNYLNCFPNTVTAKV